MIAATFLAEGRREEREARELDHRTETPDPRDGTASPQARADVREAGI